MNDINPSRYLRVIGPQEDVFVCLSSKDSVPTLSAPETYQSTSISASKMLQAT
jgi:hypothetical protein